MKAVIDSGTSLLVGPQGVIGPLIQGISVPTNCAGTEHLPTITFTIDDTDYDLTGNDYVLNVQGECLLGIQAANLPASFDYIILGDVFMRKYPSYFNLDDNTVSFMRSTNKNMTVEETLY